MPSAVCLVVDRLHSGFLGCYGNTWVHTPQLDRLAAGSFTFDQVVIDSPRLDVAYRSLWTGRHAASEGGAENPSPSGRGQGEGAVAKHVSLAMRLGQANVTTTLLTDEIEVAEHPLAADFAERVHLKLTGGAQTADSLEETRLAQFFAAAVDRVQHARGPHLLWLHTRGLGWPWDAPLEFRNQFAEEEDPPPPDSAEMPKRMLPKDFDPDELWGYSQAYAGQVALLDACLGALLDAIDELPQAERPLLSVTSARGFPLGEHRRLGSVDEALYGEVVQVPWWLCLPVGIGAAARTQALVQPTDLTPTLLDWWKLPAERPTRFAAHSLLPLLRGESETVRDRAVTIGDDGERAIRTAAWHLRLSSSGEADTLDPPRAELFVKPDDRFEVNEVSNRAPEVVSGLSEALGQFEAAAQKGASEPLAPLDDVLAHGLD